MSETVLLGQGHKITKLPRKTWEGQLSLFGLKIDSYSMRMVEIEH